MSARTAPGFEQLHDRFHAQLFGGMPDHTRRLGWSAERIAEHQRDHLRRLLAHAVEHSPFHVRRLGGSTPSRSTWQISIGCPS